MFGFNDKTSADEKKKILDEIININLALRNIDDAEKGECVICGYLTSFTSKETGRHVCSDQCLYRENGWREEATGETETGEETVPDLDASAENPEQEAEGRNE